MAIPTGARSRGLASVEGSICTGSAHPGGPLRARVDRGRIRHADHASCAHGAADDGRAPPNLRGVVSWRGRQRREAHMFLHVRLHVHGVSRARMGGSVSDSISRARASILSSTIPTDIVVDSQFSDLRYVTLALDGVGAVTIDVLLRGYRLGWSFSGPFRGTTHKGRGWGQRLVDAAIADLRGVA